MWSVIREGTGEPTFWWKISNKRRKFKLLVLQGDHFLQFPPLGCHPNFAIRKIDFENSDR